MTLDTSFLYDDVKILSDEFILSGSEYPKGPYIGLPSYAQPIIGEWDVILSNSSFCFTSNVSSRFSAVAWE